MQLSNDRTYDCLKTSCEEIKIGSVRGTGRTKSRWKREGGRHGTRERAKKRERKRESNGRTYNFPDCLTPLSANNASEKFSRECAITDFFFASSSFKFILFNWVKLRLFYFTFNFSQHART